MDNCLILVAGMPATGKTTFASYLSAHLHVPRVSTDFVKERLYDAVGFRSRAEKVKLGAAAMQIMYDFADSCLSAGTPVIAAAVPSGSTPPTSKQCRTPPCSPG